MNAAWCARKQATTCRLFQNIISGTYYCVRGKVHRARSFYLIFSTENQPKREKTHRKPAENGKRLLLLLTSWKNLTNAKPRPLCVRSSRLMDTLSITPNLAKYVASSSSVMCTASSLSRSPPTNTWVCGCVCWCGAGEWKVKVSLQNVKPEGHLPSCFSCTCYGDR